MLERDSLHNFWQLIFFNCFNFYFFLKQKPAEVKILGGIWNLRGDFFYLSIGYFLAFIYHRNVTDSNIDRVVQDEGVWPMPCSFKGGKLTLFVSHPLNFRRYISHNHGSKFCYFLDHTRNYSYLVLLNL